MRRERGVGTVVQQTRLLVDDQVVDLVDDEDDLREVEPPLEQLLVEVRVVVPLEAVADVALGVDGLVAREAEGAVEGLVRREVALQ